MRRAALALFLAPVVWLAPAACKSLPRYRPPYPNVIVILADDLGYSDLGCYGSEIYTPNLDALAQTGLQFTQCYNTARCCPTRAALLTGQYPHRAGMGHMVSSHPQPGYAGELAHDTPTFAELLHGAGYATWMTGKWHVTQQVGQWTDDDQHLGKDNWPLARGFDRYYGTIHGAGDYFDPLTLVDGDTPERAGPDYYVTDAIADRAAQWIRDGDPQQPFCLYVAFTAPHWPLHAKPEDIARYQGVYDAGWDAVRAARHARQIELGLVDADSPMSPRDRRVPAWDAAPDRAWQAARMQVYAAQVDCMDQGIGRIVAALRESGQLDNTLILFLADNGGCAEEVGKGSSRLSAPRQLRDGRALRLGNDPAVTPGPEDTYQSYGVGWANVSNTPFRLYKHFVHEGGISTPLIAHWPSGHLPQGRLVETPVHVIDVAATLCECAGVDTSQLTAPLPGTSLSPLFSGAPLPPRQLFFEHEGNRAVRSGNWKLVARGAKGAWELYDLGEDRGETHDVAAAHADVVQELAAAWQQWAEHNRVLPWPWKDN